MATPAPFDAFRYAHAHRAEVAWLCQNTNHLVPPEVVRGAIEQAVRERRYEGYPLGSGEPELLELVARDLGRPGLVPFLTSGGTESLYMLTRALLAPGDEVIASDPSYLIIHRFVELSGARTVNLDIYRPPYRLTADRIAEAVGPRTKMILLIDPLNPLGTGYPRDEVRAIAEIAHDRHLTLLNDVTYRDFSDGHALAAEFAPEETVTVWSVSKNCGLAGMRLGGLLATPERIRAIARFNTNDLGVNILAQVAAIAALRTKPAWIGQVVAQTRANGERIRAVVAGVDGTSLPAFPSRANMTVIDVARTGATPEAIQRELLERHGVFVRAGNYLSPTHGREFVRISYSNPPPDIERFAVAFPAAMRALRAPAPAAGAVR
ncbi:MAG TPA: pyridoxal phosphate-dependent aminotransferase [Thermoplasmata archaeon]|nr:pyridoxal phosphate-dependent aminotransferase [Thermoplasmata archaeon]